MLCLLPGLSKLPPPLMPGVGCSTVLYALPAAKKTALHFILSSSAMKRRIKGMNKEAEFRLRLDESLLSSWYHLLG